MITDERSSADARVTEENGGMSAEKKGSGGTVGKLWRKHGRGYYALMAVGTFLYLDITSLAGSIASADSVQNFVTSELVTFAIETLWYGVQASFWPVVWISRMGLPGLFWAVGGYLIWALLLAIALDRREKQLRKELDL
jgi:hypothetical protein